VPAWRSALEFAFPVSRRQFLAMAGVSALPLAALVASEPVPISIPNHPGAFASFEARGVPAVDPDYQLLPNGCYDVAGWYARHPYHPEAPPFQLVSPLPVIDASDYGRDLEAAVRHLPPSGGTVYCPQGVYPRATFTARSNLHFYGEPGTIFRGVNLYGGRECASYPAFDRQVSSREAASVRLLLNPPRNFYFNGITFDADGYVPKMLDEGTPDYVCLGLYCVRDVLLDNCVLQNLGYQPAFHTALLTGNRGLANIWARDCAFHGNSKDGAIGAVFLDGPRGCGFVRPTIDGYFNSWAFQFQCNDDFSIDLNGDGTIDLSERREARYNVIDGAMSTSDCHNFAGFQGFSNLVQNCSQMTHVSELVFLVSRCGSRAGCTYAFTGNVVRNNRADNADYWVTVDGSNVSGAGCANSDSTIGQYTVQGNRAMKFRTNGLVLETQPVKGPNLVASNIRPNGAEAPSVVAQLWLDAWAGLSAWISDVSLGDVVKPVSGGLGVTGRSASLRSRRLFDATQPVLVRCMVQARAAAGSSTTAFSAGLALAAPEQSNGGYAELALAGDYATGSQRISGMLATNTFTADAGAGNKNVGAYEPWSAHTLEVQWYPDDGHVYYLVDGAVEAIIPCAIDGPLQVLLRVTSLPPGAPDDGSRAEALFGPIRVQAVPAE
jgi:hypothetical protein